MNRHSPIVQRIGLLAIPIVALCGCGKETPSANKADTVVYVCSETKEIVRAPLQPSPAVNPSTGRQTLMRALYCEKCKRWHAIPPAEERSGNPLRYQCPKHKSDMSPDGPLEGE